MGEPIMRKDNIMKKLLAGLLSLGLIVAPVAGATQPSFVAGSNVYGSMPIDPVTGQAANVVAPNPTGSTTMGSLSTNGEGFRATYRYAKAALTPVASPTAFLVIQGSATKTVRIKFVRVSGVATAAGNLQIQAVRWSDGGGLGSAVLTALTAVKHDVNDVAATAVVSTVGTANYTTQGGGNATPMVADRIQLSAAGSGVTIAPITWVFGGDKSDKAFVLRGVTDFFVLSGNASAVPAGGALDISVETEEDNS